METSTEHTQPEYYTCEEYGAFSLAAAVRGCKNPPGTYVYIPGVT